MSLLHPSPPHSSPPTPVHVQDPHVSPTSQTPHPSPHPRPSYVSYTPVPTPQSPTPQSPTSQSPTPQPPHPSPPHPSPRPRPSRVSLPHPRTPTSDSHTQSPAPQIPNLRLLYPRLLHTSLPYPRPPHPSHRRLPKRRFSNHWDPWVLFYSQTCFLSGLSRSSRHVPTWDSCLSLVSGRPGPRDPRVVPVSPLSLCPCYGKVFGSRCECGFRVTVDGCRVNLDV